MTFAPKISFGVIVLNGMPFIPYLVKTFYSYAHEIIIVEGAASTATAIADEKGHSIDGTLEELKRIKAHFDPDNKIIIVTAEDEGHTNGFWPGEKDEQSQAYAKRATGDYLWQVDSDEFYLEDDLKYICNIINENPEITQISFKQITFWGGLNYTVNGPFLQNGNEIYNRLFKWGKGYTYQTHRPPTVINNKGLNLKDIHQIHGDMLAEKGIFLYHYSLLLPKQVLEKSEYYRSASWSMRDKAADWAQNVFLNLKKPFRVHNVYKYISWLEKYNAPHPYEIRLMIDDLQKTNSSMLRNTDDIEKLLNSSSYKIKRWFIKMLVHFKIYKV
jgi:hypothetical protein